MSLRDLTRQFGASKNRLQAVNAAIRALCPAGSEVLDLLELVNQMVERRACPVAVLDRLRAIRDRMADHVIAHFDEPPAPAARAQKASPAEAGPETDDLSVKLLLQSTPREPGRTDEISLTDLWPSNSHSPGDSPAAWTPDRVARLGMVADGVLAAELGISAESVRRKRAALNIPAKRGKIAWTAAMLKVLADEPDNAKAAEKIGVSVNAVKIARSRFG